MSIGGTTMFFKEQAEDCRRQAVQYAGRPEAPFLLNVARAFDELATSGHSAHGADTRRAPDPKTSCSWRRDFLTATPSTASSPRAGKA